MISSQDTEIDYFNFLNELKRISGLEKLNLKPKWITIDACKASANAIKAVFPGCTLVMCYFHLVQVVENQADHSEFKSN